MRRYVDVDKLFPQIYNCSTNIKEILKTLLCNLTAYVEKCLRRKNICVSCINLYSLEQSHIYHIRCFRITKR